MKHFSKVFAIFFLLASVFSCEESTINAPGSTNKHDNARTTANWNVTGTSTVPAGTYDMIYVHNGDNITLSNGVTFTDLNWGYYIQWGVPATISVATGATVSMTGGLNYVAYYCIFNNRGTFNNNSGHFIMNGDFNNYGTHNAWSVQVHEGNYNNKLNAYLSTESLGKTSIGKLNFSGCSIAQTINLDVPTSSTSTFVTGNGTLRITGSAVVNTVPLTGSTSAKICAYNGISYANGGSFGTGQASCAGGCL